MMLGGSLVIASSVRATPIPVGASGVTTPGTDTFTGLTPAYTSPGVAADEEVHHHRL